MIVSRVAEEAVAILTVVLTVCLDYETLIAIECVPCSTTEDNSIEGVSGD